MKELVFEVMQEADGSYTAEALGESIFTQADSWDELKANVREAVQAFYFDSAAPASISFSQKLWKDAEHERRPYGTPDALLVSRTPR
ncbi:MAG: hypothetical protein ABSC48_00520 [Terracidiphilus sp.]|jgi:hypothetical protein